MSALALALIAEAKRTRAARLDLGKCGLTELPDELFELTWLEELILGDEWIEYTFEKEQWEKLKSQNEGEANNIKSLSPKIKKLERLKKLVACGKYNTQWDLSDLTPLAALTQLQLLDVSNTQVIDLTPLAALTQLQLLDVHSTQVSDLTPLAALTQLQLLYVSNTQVIDLSPLVALTQLQKLDVTLTQVIDLSPLVALTQLQKLFVSDTQVIDLSPLVALTQLQKLDVTWTQVSDLTPLAALTQLQQLFVSYTQVSDLSPLATLTQLQQLDVSSTQVIDLSPLKSIIKKGIEVKWSNEWWRDGNGIYVKDCPLDKAFIAAIKKGQEAVLAYLNKPKERLFEARVLILGEPGAGKTTLRRKLKSNNAPMPTKKESTKAFEVEIEPYRCNIEKNNEKNKLIYHLWDFGGQDYYRLLHQLFVSEQSVYIIVTDTRRGQMNEGEIDFWLETIQRLGKDKKDKYGPVILFQNPQSGHEGDDYADLKKRYSFWKQNEQFLINLNALSENTDTYNKKEHDKFKRFKKHLEESFCQLDHIGKEMPKQWINVRKALNKYEKDNWITVERFYQICDEKKIKSETEQEDLLDIFHSLGFVLHYKSKSLKGMVILNREWVTDALYRVLDDKIVTDNKGWFYTSDAEKIWYEPKYKNRTEELLYLMQEFKLSYFNELSKKHIIPAKLNKNTDGLPEWDKTQNVRLHLQYDWMPRAIPTQLIVSLHDNIVDLEDNEQWIWREGAVLDGRQLELKDVQIRIEDNWRDNRIEISAKGQHSDVLIRTIMKNWRKVNQPFEDKVEVRKIILCSCETCIDSNSPHLFKYENVLNALEKGKALQCNESLDPFSAQNILKGIFDETTQLVDLATIKGVNSEILDLIADGKIGEAFDLLPNHKTIILLKHRYESLVLDNIRGFLDYDTYKINLNKIVSALLEYLDFEREDKYGRRIRVSIEEYEIENRINTTIEKDKQQTSIINIYGGQVNIGQNINDVGYHENNKISKEDFDALKAQIETLGETNLEVIKTYIRTEPVPKDESEKEAIGVRIYNWLNKNAEGIVGNVAASVYYDGLKFLFGI